MSDDDTRLIPTLGRAQLLIGPASDNPILAKLEPGAIRIGIVGKYGDLTAVALSATQVAELQSALAEATRQPTLQGWTDRHRSRFND